MRLAGWIGSAGVVLGVCTASATVERSIEVAQPIVTEETICIHNVTYITYWQGTWGEVVDYTGSKNFIVVGDHSNPEDRNAASLAGVKVKTDPYHFQAQALYGDTLRVVLDLSAMDVSKSDFEAADIVDATLECVLINATRSMQGWDGKASASVPARYLRVDVQGAEDYTHLTHTYSLAELQKSIPGRGCYGATPRLH